MALVQGHLTKSAVPHGCAEGAGKGKGFSLVKVGGVGRGEGGETTLSPCFMLPHLLHVPSPLMCPHLAHTHQHRNGTLLASADGNGRIIVWSVAQRRALYGIRTLPDGLQLQGLSFSPDGT